MAIVFKANVAYGGDLVLPSVKQVTHTAEQLYGEYALRVAADGGEIIDPVRTLAAIANAQSAGLYGRLRTAVSASWGVKLSVDRVVKMYAIDGNDLEGFTVGAGGTLPLHTTDASGDPVVVTDVNSSRVGGLLRSIDPFYLADRLDRYCAIVANHTVTDRTACMIAFGNVPVSLTGYAGTVLSVSPSGISVTAQQSGYVDTDPADAGKRIALNAEGSGDGGSRAKSVALKIDTGDVRAVRDGAVVGSTTSPTGALADYTTLEKRLYVGSLYDGSANITPDRGGQIRDVYVVSQATLDEIRELTATISAAYL